MMWTESQEIDSTNTQLHGRRDIFRKLRKDSATPAYLEKFKRELAQIENVLSGREFDEFLRWHLLTLQIPR
jgi:hypothetical protein